MFSTGLNLIKNEWKLSFFFLSIISILGCIPIFIYNSFLLNAFLYLLGLDLYNGYFLTMGKILKGQKVENPYKDIFFGKDKNRSDFLILIVFFGAILMIFKGPMIIVNVLFAEKFNEFIASSGSVMIIFSIISVFAFSLYKISIYAAIASLKYFNNEVIDSFKTGIKGIWNFKVFVVLLFLFEFAAAVIIQVQTPILVIIVNLSYYIIPAVLMTFMISKYWLDENIEHSAE